MKAAQCSAILALILLAFEVRAATVCVAQPGAAQVARQAAACAAPRKEVATAATASGLGVAPVAEPVVPETDVAGKFRLAMADRNLRQFFARIAADQSPRWELVWDVPLEYAIGGEDSFTGSFKDAVRYFAAGTEMTELAVQPCFYRNRVLRIIRKTLKCDPTK